MSIFASPRFLPRVMWADAALCAATGVLQWGAARPMADLMGLPASLLTGTGLFLVVYALAVAWIARREPTPRALIGLVAVCNLGWALACGALLWSGRPVLTDWGMAWLSLQIVAVVVFAELQWRGLRRSRSRRPGVRRATA